MTKPNSPIDRTISINLGSMQPVTEALQISQSRIARLGLDLQPQIEAWRKSWADSVRGVLEAIERGDHQFAPKARELGDLGWTLPMWASPDFVTSILEEVGPDEVDAAFVEIYTYERRKNFIQLFKGLEERSVLKLWIGLLRDCRWAYYRKKYRLAVPSLLLVLDGLLSVAGDTWTVHESALKTTARLSKRSKGLDLCIWLSIDAFVRQIFQRWEFYDPRPPMINRHWILHGRDEPDWTPADCLRLFQAIDTVSSILDQGHLVRGNLLRRCIPPR